MDSPGGVPTMSVAPTPSQDKQGALASATTLVTTLKDISSSTIKDAFNGIRIGVTRATGRGDTYTQDSGDRTPHTADLQPMPSFTSQMLSDQQHRVARFVKLLDEPVVDLDALRKLAWSGIPAEVRPDCWRLLLGYMPPRKERQARTLARKRAEYMALVPQLYDLPPSVRDEDELAALRQVQVDVPRTAASVAFFQQPAIQQSLERLLYIWGMRHPASGYVQGMNDLVTPFLMVFLGEHLPGPVESWSEEQLQQEALLSVEADCYWCLCKLIEGIQDHYTHSQPGIQRAVFRIEEIVMERDPLLAGKLAEEGVAFIQFAWRWVNCLLLRELPFALAPRLWDNYLVEGTGLVDYLLLLCAEFLLQWRTELMGMEFQEIIMMLQRPPTSDWTDKELVQLLSRASYHTIDKSRMMKDEKAIMLPI